MKCPVCSSQETSLIFSKYPGYIEGDFFDIWACRSCEINFISPFKTSSKLYETIYSSTSTPGYERYYEYAKRVKSEKDPLKFLSDSELTFFPVHEFIKSAGRSLKILEVGCSYGYLTYALRQKGHDAFGIDVSKNAVNFAKKAFGNFFSDESLEDISKKGKKFDVVIATEVIEHLDRPLEFIKNCFSVLNSGGVLILTTPNKDYFGKASAWQTDNPPLHTLWLGRKAFEFLAEKFDADLEFTDFSGYYPKTENKLVTFFLTRKENIQQSVLSADGKRARSEPFSSQTWNAARMILINFSPLRIFFNFMHNFIRKDYRSLGVILKKR